MSVGIMTRWGWGRGLLAMLLATVTLSAAGDVTAKEPTKPNPEGWIELFDGETLKGWTPKSGTAKYHVDEHCIVGVTEKGSPNTFLCHEKEFGDFELVFQVLLVDDALNSGVQIRSQWDPKIQDGHVRGPQVEISTDNEAGWIYGEGLDTGWLTTDRTDAAARAAFKKGEWNDYRILAQGNHIQTWVNTIPVADLTDEKSGMKSGLIGLQVHGIPVDQGPYEVRWRHIRIRELSGKK